MLAAGGPVAGCRAPPGAALVRYLWPSWPPQRLLLILDAYHNDIYFLGKIGVSRRAKPVSILLLLAGVAAVR
jgi:hypothetical protein